MEFNTIKVDIRENKIGIITLNRPEKRNAISIQMRKEIHIAFVNGEKHQPLTP